MSEKQLHNKVFIIHGHNEEVKQSIARLIEKCNIQVIILHEQPNNGQTIIEKIECYNDADAAICLLTADDIGYEKNSTQKNRRARQNVILETGYFIGKLSRKKVIIVAENDLELPSDLQGIVYINKHNDNSWKLSVLKELKSIGYNIDLNDVV